MSIKLTLNQAELRLPNIDSIKGSEQAFSKAFLKSSHILHQHLEQIKLTLGEVKDFTNEPYNLAILGLFSKMSRHYYSYVFLELHHDRIGSQLLIEQLCEAAITLIYLLEEGDNSLFCEYISASVHQASSLLIEVAEQLQQFPHHPDSLRLKAQLEAFINKHQEQAAESWHTDATPYVWGPESANTTAKRAKVIGLNFLPARDVALRVMPASLLELQLNDWHSLTDSSQIAPPGINFTALRDAAHLCLHATQIFLEEVTNYQDVQVTEIECQQQLLNTLYEWFYNAHAVYQLHCVEQFMQRALLKA
jgi:hypothetical protein